MANPQDALNAAFPGASNGDAVYDEGLGLYWIYDSGQGLWVVLGENIDVNYYNYNVSGIDPYEYEDIVKGSCSIGVNVEGINYSLIPTQELIESSIAIGGSVSSIAVKLDPPFADVTITPGTPGIFLNNTIVYFDTTSILFTELIPTVEASEGIEIDTVVSITQIEYEPIVLATAPFPLSTITVNTGTPVIQAMESPSTVNVNIETYEPEKVGSFLLANITSINFTTYEPVIPQVSVQPTYITVFDGFFNTPEVKSSLTPDTVSISLNVNTVTTFTGTGVVPSDVAVNIVAPVPVIDAYPDVWEAGWWGGWTLNWNQAEDTYNMNYQGFTVPAQEDVDIACAWNKPFLQDAYKTSAGVTSPNPINSINGRRAEAPTKLYPNDPTQKYSGEFTSSTEGCPQIVFTETIGWGHPEVTFDKYTFAPEWAHSPFADWCDGDKQWAYADQFLPVQRQRLTYEPENNVPDLNEESYNDNGNREGHYAGFEFIKNFSSGNFFHPGGAMHLNKPTISISNANSNYHSSHADIGGVFTLELWIYPTSANFTGSTPSDYVPIICHNQYWHIDQNHDPYIGTLGAYAQDERVSYGDNYYTGWDLYFHGSGGTGTVEFRGSIDRYRLDNFASIRNDLRLSDAISSSMYQSSFFTSYNNGSCPVNDNPLSIFGIAHPEYTSVQWHSVNGTNVTDAEEPAYYDYRVTGKANALIANQWNHIVLHSDGAGYTNIAVNGEWGSDQRLTCSDNAAHYDRFAEILYNRVISNLRFKDVPTGAVSHTASYMDRTCELQCDDKANWLHEINHTNFSKLTLGAFTEPFYTWDEPPTDGSFMEYLATSEFTDLIPGNHNRFQGYIHEIRYCPFLKYDDRYWRHSFLTDSPTATAGTFSLPGDNGIPGVTWPDFNTNLPNKPFPYSFGRRDVEGTIHTVCTSIYEPDMRRYYWHTFNRTAIISQHYNNWTGIPVDWYKEVNKFIIGCKKDGNWWKMDDVYLFVGYQMHISNGYTLRGMDLSDYEELTDGEIRYTLRDPLIDRRYGISNRLGGNVEQSNLRGIRLARSNANWPESNHHRACWVTRVGTGPVFSSGVGEIGGTTCNWIAGRGGVEHGFVTNSKTTEGTDAISGSPCFIGFSRSSRDSYDYVIPGLSGVQTRNVPSQTPWMEPVELLKTSTDQTLDYPTADMSNHSLGFYSQGKSIDLGKLERRVTMLMTAWDTYKNQYQPEQFYIGNNW